MTPTRTWMLPSFSGMRFSMMGSDGVSVQDNYLKTTDGFFARMSPRIDAVEQVTVTTAGQGADATSQGSAQIRFTTRSGSNAFTGSGYYYYQADELDTNTYFNKVRNLTKGERTQNQPGVRVGGPVVIPGLFDGRNKAFFFVNYEVSRTPSTRTQNTTVMRPSAINGTFVSGILCHCVPSMVLLVVICR